MSGIQNEMFKELESKEIFELAKQFAYKYQEGVRARNVYPTADALRDLKNFEEDLPVKPSKASDVIRQLEKYGAPATTTILGGRYYGFVNGGAVPAGLAAKWMADFWDQNAAMQVISPIASKLEVVVERWLRELLGLPASTVAGFVSGSFSAIFCGLVAARYRILKRQNWDVGEKGLMNAPPIRVVTSVQTHSTVLKAIALIGLGRENIEMIDVDDQGRIIPEKIPALDDKTILILQAGNVNSGCFEDFERICVMANKANAWVHVDGAFGLWASAVASLKHLTKGMELASSWSVDGHKALNTPYDCGIILCADGEALVSALHMSGSYIVLGDERDGMFYTPEMSRRARVIELWAVMKYLGKAGIDEMLVGLCQRARQFADELKTHGFEILNEVVFNQVLVYYKNDEATMEILKDVQEQRVCWCGGSSWHGKKVIRLSVCSWATTPEDISLSVKSFVVAKDRL
ncbi:aspartate aminotransferase family protein [Cytophagales bacterium WSM2-2]|nr:aspartate aminotransferase family protein [Cytophagales bacterium WSM2-2]